MIPENYKELSESAKQKIKRQVIKKVEDAFKTDQVALLIAFMEQENKELLGYGTLLSQALERKNKEALSFCAKHTEKLQSVLPIWVKGVAERESQEAVLDLISFASETLPNVAKIYEKAIKDKSRKAEPKKLEKKENAVQQMRFEKTKTLKQIKGAQAKTEKVDPFNRKKGPTPEDLWEKAIEEGREEEYLAKLDAQAEKKLAKIGVEKTTKEMSDEDAWQNVQMKKNSVMGVVLSDEEQDEQAYIAAQKYRIPDYEQVTGPTAYFESLNQLTLKENGLKEDKMVDKKRFKK